MCFISKDSFLADIPLHKTVYHVLHKEQKYREYGKTSQAENTLAQNTDFSEWRKTCCM